MTKQEFEKLAIRNGETISGLTNEYTELIITAASDDECRRILEGQISDGIFENCATGIVSIVEIKEV